MMKKSFFSLFVNLSVVFFVSASSKVADRGVHEIKPSTKVVLAVNGKSNYPIVIAANSSAEIKAIANTLATKLNQISNGKFTVVEGDGTKGIALGTQSTFGSTVLKTNFDTSNPRDQQGFEIKTHSHGVYLIGATKVGLEYATFHFLEKLGYRMFFQQEKWEIVPKLSKLEVAFHIKETPDYVHRRVWPGFGVWPEFVKSSNLWDKVNKNGGYPLQTGHAYDEFVEAHEEVFKKHPEYHALVNGKRKSENDLPKLCISNENLRNLIADYAIKTFEKDPNLASFSVDPSDGGGWCECQPCVKIGSPSTRATLLANTVAIAVRAKFSGKRIGMYAYNLHSVPPEIKVDKDVVVSTATRFIRGGLTLNQMIEGWTAQGAVLGIREYYDVYIWSKHLPGKSDGGNLNYLKTTISDFYNKGARYLTSEASDAIGPNGLGDYLSLRMMWNVNEINNLIALKEDFAKKSFGPAANTMIKFYEYLDGANKNLISEDLVARMYLQIEKARLEAKSSPEIISRIDDLAAYVHYVELFVKFESLSGKKGELEAFNKLSSFIRDSKKHRIVHTYAMFKGSHWKGMAPKGAAEVNLDVNVDYIPSNKIDTIVKDGIVNNKLIDFVPVDFTGDLVVTNHEKNPRFEYGKLLSRRGFRVYYTWVLPDLKPIEIDVIGGLIPHYRDRGNVKIKLINIGGASNTGERETVEQEDLSTVPNGILNKVVLKPKQQGLYAVTFDDGNDNTSEEWLNYNKTFKSEKLLTGTFYAYVPKGTIKLGMYLNAKRGQIVDHKGRVVFKFNDHVGYFSTDLADDQGGRMLSFVNVSGEINLMTIPPYFTLDPTQITLPSEIVVKDKLSVSEIKGDAVNGNVDEIVPALIKPSSSFKPGFLTPRRGERAYYTWVNKDLKPLEIKVRGGMIRHYRNRGNVKVELLKIKDAKSVKLGTHIAIDQSAIPDSTFYEIELKPKQEGLHAVLINDGNDMTEDHWINYNKTFKSDGEFSGTFYCYIPKGQGTLTFFCNSIRRGRLIDASGKTLLQFNNHAGDQTVDIPESSQGKMICFWNVAGDIKLVNVPPYFSTNPTEILLPKALVEKDGLAN